MKCFLVIVIYLSLLPSQAASIKSKIGCTHPQVCNLINALLPNNQAVLLKKIGSDPHHDKLKARELKEMLNVDFLVLPPLPLQPWVQSIIKKRTKPTYTFSNLYADYKNSYPQLTINRTAHFWLYPEILCQYLENLAKELTSWGFKPTSYSCLLERLNQKFQKIKACSPKQTFILSHSAAIPLMEHYGLHTLAAKAAGHGQTLTGKQIKSLTDEIHNNPHIFWILEKRITLPNAIKKLQMSIHKKIELDTLGTATQPPLQTLETLANKLEQQLCP